DYEKKYRQIASTMDRNTSRGLKTVARIVERLQIKGYYGPLYDLFTVDENLQTAVEVVAGASLFHLVVDTDTTATLILDALNKERGGRVTFMPLNRLRPRESVYPDSEQAIPLMSRLEYDPMFRPAMLQVFGKAILAPSLEEASAFARSHQLTGITFDGDRADRKGALTGGYHDYSSTRLETIAAMREAKKSMDADERRLQDIKLRLLQVEQEILTLRDQLAAADAKKRSILASREPIAAEIASKTQKWEQAESYVAQEETALAGLAANLASLEHQTLLAREELSSPFRKKLDAGEAAQLARLPALVEEARLKQSDLIVARTKVQTGGSSVAGNTQKHP
ncbi:Structural maintenance of chromosomes protein 3, partial [Kappamyces sp. JEL0680]